MLFQDLLILKPTLGTTHYLATLFSMDFQVLVVKKLYNQQKCGPPQRKHFNFKIH